jgi:hypothetical protein
VLSFAGALGPLFIFFFVLEVAAFGVEAWALVDAIRRPATAFLAAGKQTKPIWLLILGVATVIGLGSVVYQLNLIGIFPIVAFVAAAIYLADVRPKVREFSGRNRSGGARMGPYGPW